MPAAPRKIPTIDFRPRRQWPWGVVGLAMLLLGGVIWWGWQWIAPYDRALLIEKQLNQVALEELKPLFDSLPALESPGYRVLFGALGHSQPEVRRAARLSLSEVLDRWAREPKHQPANFAELTVMLAERANAFPLAERQEAQEVFRRWVNLASPAKVNASIAQREFHARRQLLEWVSEPRMAQPPRLRGQERAERRAALQETVVTTTQQISRSIEQAAARFVLPALPRETKFQVVAVNQEPEPSPAPPTGNEPRLLNSGQSNQPAQLTSGPNSEAQPISPLRLEPSDSGAIRRISANVMTSAELLATDAPARYRSELPAARQQWRSELAAAGIGPADLEMLDLYASAPAATLVETINALPHRGEVAAQLWLRQFGQHPESTVRKAAWSWLITSPDRATQQWLAERAATESDGDLREWYQTMTKQRKLR